MCGGQYVTCPSGKSCSQMQYGKGSPLQKKNLKGDWTNILSHSVRVNKINKSYDVVHTPHRKAFSSVLCTASDDKMLFSFDKTATLFGDRLWVCFHKPFVSCISTEKLVETAVIEINFP